MTATGRPDAEDVPDGGPGSPDDSPGHALGRIYGPLAAAALVVLTIDQLTKIWADDLAPCNTLVERPRFAFCLAYNEGMAFSVGWGKGPLIALVALGIVTALVVSARKVPLSSRVLMGIVAGGALGNVTDRAFRAPHNGAAGFMRGAVVDFLYSNFWATFNVADMAVVVGGILLSIALWRLPDPDGAADGDAGGDAGGTRTGASADAAGTPVSTDHDAEPST